MARGSVIPAQAGIHCGNGCGSIGIQREWFPACVGMTAGGKLK